MDIASAVSAINASTKLMKLFLDAKTQVDKEAIASELNGKIFHIQQSLINLQAEYAQCQQKNAELTKQLNNIQSWEALSKSYQLTELAPGVLTYIYKKDGDTDDTPIHYACSNCFQSQQLSILQAAEKNIYGVKYTCPSCKVTINDFSKKKPNQRSPRSTSWQS